jgi:predicted component of type VI protein secretion system
MNSDHVTIIEPNGVQRTKPITPRGMSIGRGDENDLVISYAAVSRAHALITYDQGRYHVVDLNSGNGTYLDQTRLAPNTPTVWRPGQTLHIGDAILHLEQSASADSGSETFVGWFPDDERRRAGQTSGSAIKWFLIALAIVLLVVALGIAAYLTMP